MIKPGFGADKSVYDNIDWSGFGVGANPAIVDIKDGKVLRVRRFDYSATYDLDKDLRRFRLEKDGKVFVEPTKSCIPPFSWAYKKHAFSKNRIPYPMIRESFDPDGDRHPELRGIDKYRRISWDEALDIIAKEIHRQYELYGPNSILVQQDGHGETKIVHPCHGCMTRLLDLLGGCVLQARQPDSWEGWYWGAKHVWGQEPLGQGRTQNLFYDITHNTKMILYWGCDNETTTWGWCGQLPSLMSFWWTDIGIESIFISPDLNYSAAVHADKWIPVYPNTDLALQLAIAYVWITEGIYDREYIDTHTIGFDWLEYEVMGGDDGVPKTPEWASPRCGVPVRTIKALARNWHELPTSTAHSNGGSYIRSCYSHEPGRMEACLLAMQGLGKPGRNYMKFIEWNIYECPDFNPMPRVEMYPSGFGGYNASMLQEERDIFIPKTLIPEGILATKEEPIDWYGHVICMMPADDQTKHFTFPAREGDPTLHMIWSDSPCWSTCWNGGNEFLNALHSENLDFVLIQHPWFENDTHSADIILPVASRFEVDDCGYDSQTGMFPTILKCDKAVEPLGEARSDWECVQAVATRLEELYGDEELYKDIYERYCNGRHNAEETLEVFYKFTGVEKYRSYEDWLEKGYTSVPHVAEWQEDPSGFYEFYKDPERYPLDTPTGKIEIYSTRLAQHFPDDDERRPYPHYIASTDRFHEYREDPKAEKYPFLLCSNHPRFRVHANFDDNAWLREIEPCKITGPDGYMYETVWINPVDAERLDIKTGDIVRILNDRGWVMGGAWVTERIRPGVISQDHGARTDPIVYGESDRSGANNLISPKEITSKNCAGEVTSGYLVDIE
nr:molybdopterin-dependent oxidoreductase [bacterium]